MARFCRPLYAHYTATCSVVVPRRCEPPPTGGVPENANVVVLRKRRFWPRDMPTYGAMDGDTRAEAEAEAEDAMLLAQRFARYVACESQRPHFAGYRPVAQMVYVLSTAACVTFKWIRERLKLGDKKMKAYMKLKQETPTEENRQVEALLAAFVADYLRGKYDDDVRQMPQASEKRTSDKISEFFAKLDARPGGIEQWAARRKRSFADLSGDGKQPSSDVMPGTNDGNGAPPRETNSDQQCGEAEQRPIKRAKRHEGLAWWRLCVACDEPLPSKEDYARHLKTAFHRAADELHKAGTPMRTWSALRVNKATGELHCVPTGRKPKTYEEWEQHRRSDEYWFAMTAADPRYKSKIIDEILE